MAAIEPTHLLSNGRYTVSAARQRRRLEPLGPRHGVTRSRDDALRDAYGSFFHLRWDRQPRAGLAHPAPGARPRRRTTTAASTPTASGSTPSGPRSRPQTTVWVSPEDDIEFRRVELRNLGDRMLDLELISAFEVTLADARADEAHPAFQNLFVSAEWQAGHQALVFERKPRLATDKGVLAAHFLAEAEPRGDRPAAAGRPAALARPQPRRRAIRWPRSTSRRSRAEGGESVPLDTGLDPVARVRRTRLQIAPGGKARVTFCTAAADNRATLRAVIDKYRQPSHVERASMMSATLAGIRLRDMRHRRRDLRRDPDPHHRCW